MRPCSEGSWSTFAAWAVEADQVATRPQRQSCKPCHARPRTRHLPRLDDRSCKRDTGPPAKVQPLDIIPAVCCHLGDLRKSTQEIIGGQKNRRSNKLQNWRANARLQVIKRGCAQCHRLIPGTEPAASARCHSIRQQMTVTIWTVMEGALATYRCGYEAEPSHNVPADRHVQQRIRHPH